MVVQCEQTTLWATLRIMCREEVGQSLQGRVRFLLRVRLQHGNNPDCSTGAVSDRWRGLGIFAVAQLTRPPDKHIQTLLDPICGLAEKRSTPKIDRGYSLRLRKLGQPTKDVSSKKTKVYLYLALQESRDSGTEDLRVVGVIIHVAAEHIRVHPHFIRRVPSSSPIRSSCRERAVPAVALRERWCPKTQQPESWTKECSRRKVSGKYGRRIRGDSGQVATTRRVPHSKLQGQQAVFHLHHRPHCSLRN
jgi:hypothetical protein